MPEALEKWPVDLFSDLLPRIYIIVEEIDRRFRIQLEERYPGDTGKIEYMSILSGGVVKMANLAVVGSFSVNGVAEVHSELLKSEVLKDLYEFFPEKFANKTNGVTHRRWLIHANSSLTDMITDVIGSKWKKNPAELENLAKFKGDGALLDRLFAIKRAGKERLAGIVEERCGVRFDPDSIFDAQVKRIHAYKRQLLNALHIHYLYNRIVEDSSFEFTPRSFIFAGKAAPSYHFAKHTIKYINDLAKLVNNDPRVKGKIKIAFLENYNVGLAERIFPASDVSEQISTASKEASGTGNMKFMINGAVTIGTDDGANIEIRRLVGDDNFILFGLKVEEVLHLYKHGGYSARELYNQNPHIKQILDQIISGAMLPTTPKEARDSIIRQLLDYNDEYFVLKDFDSYRIAHERVNSLYDRKDVWGAMSVMNIAMAGNFSSDITIARYASEIWKLKKCAPK
jgi:starch phosphorylase